MLASRMSESANQIHACFSSSQSDACLLVSQPIKCMHFCVAANQIFVSKACACLLRWTQMDPESNPNPVVFIVRTLYDVVNCVCCDIYSGAF